MSTFVKACAASEIAPGTGKTVAVEGKELALFNVDGTFHAIDNECPHRGGPLAEGELEGLHRHLSVARLAVRPDVPARASPTT